MPRVRAARAWLEAAQLEAGSVFRRVTRYRHIAAWPRSGRSVARVVRRSADAVGLNAIILQTGQRSANMVARYVREGPLIEDNAAAGIG